MESHWRMKRKSIAGIVKEEKVIMNKDAASGFTFRRFQIQYIRLKYHNKRYYAEIFGKELADEFEFQIRRWGIQAIIPIPLHRSKMRKRGYNQAELLAKQLSECMGIPIEKDVLYRIKKTRPLKEMNGEQRHRNLKGAFAVSKSWNPRQNILLIDDIYTTGSTIERAAGILKKAGVKNVYFLTLSIGQGI